MNQTPALAEPAATPARTLPPSATALLLALVAVLLLFRLGAVPLLGPDEPRYARVAVEMQRSGNYVSPTLQGVAWLEKPALYYWLASAAVSVLGETEVAVRLPSVMAGVLLVGATALFGARLHGTGAGLHAGFVLGTSVLFFAFGRAASMDMLLAASVTGAIGFLGLRILGIAGSWAVPAAYVCMGVGTLAKGPLGVVIPALVVAGELLLTRDLRIIRTVLSWRGLLLFLLVTAPWYGLAYRAEGQRFVDVFLVNHNLQRFTSTIHRHPGPPYYYLPILVAGLFPWSGLIVPGLAALRPRVAAADRWLMCWLIAPLLFFSVAGSKLPGYILPCLPPLAILSGRAAQELVAGRGGVLATRAAAVLGLALGSVAATTPFLLWRLGEPGWLSTLPFALWALVLTFGFSRRVRADPVGALRLLRVGAAGLLLLLISAAPPILARRESGRDVFRATSGREVLVWGARRTVWMAGYFYNDGRVREISGIEDIRAASSVQPVLVLCGPAQRRVLDASLGWSVRLLAEAAGGTTLLDVTPRPGG